MAKFRSGALVDTRPIEKKIKDYKFNEIVASTNPVNWVEKPQSEWRKFPIFNQNGSGSCVAQTLAKLLGVMYWLKNNIYVHFSATHIYQRRTNKPTPGMIGANAFQIASESATLEQLVPSQNMTDAQMDREIIEQYKDDVGKIFSVPNYVEMPTQDIETVASVIQTTGKAVMVWFYFTMGEWNQAVPQIVNPSLTRQNAPGLHSVPAVDFTLYNGKKALIIEDSWGESAGLHGQRVITEDFFKVRNWYAGYPVNFKFDSQTTPKPKYTFITPMYLGQNTNDVKSLQDILKYEGFFPINQGSTGYYGAITAKAVLAFQKKYKVASDTELTQLAGSRAGSATIAKLNELYS
jgi:hypothetical protein